MVVLLALSSHFEVAMALSVGNLPPEWVVKLYFECVVQQSQFVYEFFNAVDAQLQIIECPNL